MPSLSTYPHQGLSSGNRWGRRPFPCPSKLLKAAHWEPTSTPWPSRKPPTPGKAPTRHTHSRSEPSLIYLFYFSYQISIFSLLWGRMGDSVLCPPPPRGWMCPLSNCLPGYRRRRQHKKNDPSQCLTVKQWLRDNSIKQINGFVYQAKLNSTLLNEDAFALSIRYQEQRHHFSSWCISFI